MDTVENAQATESTQVEQTVDTVSSSEQSTETKVFDTQAQEPGVSWMWGDDLPGQGDKPEWFKDSKYKTISEQAKAYGELEKRLGGFVGAPKEGYQLSGDLGVDSSDPAIKAVLDVLGKNNASNDVANELISAYTTEQKRLGEEYKAKELERLGANADYRLKAIQEFSHSAIPENLREAFSGMISNAQSVEVIEAIMKKAQGSVVAPSTATVEAKIDGVKLREMMFAKNDNGQLKASIDPEYKKMVDKAYKDYYGA